jgi:hypothetical protein
MKPEKATRKAKGVPTLKDISLAERKIEANKPLYLIRYE